MFFNIDLHEGQAYKKAYDTFVSCWHMYMQFYFFTMEMFPWSTTITLWIGNKNWYAINSRVYYLLLHWKTNPLNPTFFCVLIFPLLSLDLDCFLYISHLWILFLFALTPKHQDNANLHRKAAHIGLAWHLGANE